MAGPNRWIKSILSAAVFVLVLAGWLIFAPVNIGGQTSYVTLVGNSMEPGFHRGDLVLVREVDVYPVGEIVAYRHPNIGTVFHRIIQKQDASFILKGDNNSWKDSAEITQEQIIGRLWLHIPFVGKYLQYLRTPGMFALVVAGLGLFSMAPLFYENMRSSKFNNHSRNQNKKNRSIEVIDMEKKIPESLYTIAVIGFAAFLLALFSFSAPLERIVPDNYEFTHNGKFDYFAAVPQEVYEGGFLQSGDPVFRKVNNSINIIFSYGFDAGQQIAQVYGTYRLTAEISESSGWKRTLEIIPLSNFSGKKFTSTGILDISQIQELTDSLESQTGIFNNRYILAIRPETTILGKLGGRDINDTFSPGLMFSFEDLKLELLKGNSDSADSLNPQKIGIVAGNRTASNTIPILGFGLNVLIARIIAVFALMSSLVGFTWIAIKILRSGKNGEVDRIQSLYGSLLVDVRSGNFLSKKIIEVSDMQQLAKIAAQDQSMIYHLIRANTHHYFVTASNNSNISYHFQLCLSEPVKTLQG